MTRVSHPKLSHDVGMVCAFTGSYNMGFSIEDMSSPTRRHQLK
uniref:Uncharacterized protein n=1 Tax=Rhizophora mucronata TaxID=61149 RepID=A0A2P2IS86_RHIMU